MTILLIKILLIWTFASIILAIGNYKFHKTFPDLEDKN